MAEIQTIIKHEGKAYSAELATIRSTFFGTEHHGIVSANLNLEWNGAGVSVGGYCLDEPRIEDGERLGRFDTAYGLDHLMRIMETVGVAKWEDLPGERVFALFEGSGGWGSSAVGIAGITSDAVLIFKDHAATFIDKKDN